MEFNFPCVISIDRLELELFGLHIYRYIFYPFYIYTFISRHTRVIRVVGFCIARQDTIHRTEGEAAEHLIDHEPIYD